MAGASSSASMTPTTCSRSTPERRSRHGSRKWPGRGARLCSSSATSSFTGKGWSTSSTSSASPAPGCSPGNGSSLAAVTPRRHSTHSRRSCGRLQPEADVFPRTITNCDPEIPAARGTDHIRPFGAQRVIKLTEHYYAGNGGSHVARCAANMHQASRGGCYDARTGSLNAMTAWLATGRRGSENGRMNDEPIPAGEVEDWTAHISALNHNVIRDPHDDAAAGHAVATLWSSYGWQGAPFAVQQLLVQAIETGYCLALGDVRDGNFDAEIKMWRPQIADD